MLFRGGQPQREHAAATMHRGIAELFERSPRSHADIGGLEQERNRLIYQQRLSLKDRVYLKLRSKIGKLQSRMDGSR